MRKKRHVVIVEDPSALMPIDWMLAVLRDPQAEQNRRDQMAALAAPYVHARLSAAMVSTHSSSSKSRDNGDTNGLQILAVPRGAGSALKTGQSRSMASLASWKPIEPFTGTPALTDQRDYNERAEPERARFEVSELEPPQNVTRMDSFKNKRDSDDNNDDPPAAAWAEAASARQEQINKQIRALLGRLPTRAPTQAPDGEQETGGTCRPH